MEEIVDKELATIGARSMTAVFNGIKPDYAPAALLVSINPLGVGSGRESARRASRVDPLVALRSE